MVLSVDFSRLMNFYAVHLIQKDIGKHNTRFCMPLLIFPQMVISRAVLMRLPYPTYCNFEVLCYVQLAEPYKKSLPFIRAATRRSNL